MLQCLLFLKKIYFTSVSLSNNIQVLHKPKQMESYLQANVWNLNVSSSIVLEKGTWMSCLHANRS